MEQLTPLHQLNGVDAYGVTFGLGVLATLLSFFILPLSGCILRVMFGTYSSS
jgi:hypothetical protein